MSDARTERLKQRAIDAIHNALADILEMAETPKERSDILRAAGQNLLRSAEL